MRMRVTCKTNMIFYHNSNELPQPVIDQRLPRSTRGIPLSCPFKRNVTIGPLFRPTHLQHDTLPAALTSHKHKFLQPKIGIAFRTDRSAQGHASM